MKKAVKVFPLIIILLLGSSYGFTQKSDELDDFLIEWFEPQATLEITYNSNDFLRIPKKARVLDELSMDKINELKDSLEISGDKEFLMRIGMLYNRMNMPKEAQEYLYKAIDKYKLDLAKDSSNKQLLDDIFMMYFGLEDMKTALTYNESILNLYPNDTTSMAVRGFLYLSLGEHQKAVEFSESMIERFPDLGIMYFIKTLSYTYIDLFKMQTEITQEGATNWRSLNVDLTHLDVIKSKYPDNVEIQLMALCSEYFVFFYDALIPVMEMGSIDPKGFVFPINDSQLEKMKVFETRFNEILKNPSFENDYTVKYSLGLLEMLRSSYKKAIPYFEESIKVRTLEYRDLMSNAVSTFDNLIAAHMFLGDMKSAEEWQSEKIKQRAGVDPRAIDYEKLALFKLFRGELKSGEATMKKTLEIDSRHYDAYAYMARIQLLKGNYGKAEEYINIVYEAQPDNKVMYKSLILFSIYTGDVETATFLNDRLLEGDEGDRFAVAVQEFIK